MFENQVEKLIRKSLKCFHRILYIHFGLTILMLAVGSVSIVFSLGSAGSTNVPYFFSIFVSAVWHIVLLGIAVASIRILKASAEKRKLARKWIMAYSMAGSIFVLWNVMGIVFAVVNGICNTGQLCYYDKNFHVNRAMAISIIFLHSVSMVLQIFLSRKTHLYEVEFENDISIKLGHDWVLSKRAPLESVTSTGSFQSSRSLSSSESVKKEDQDETEHRASAAKTIVVIEVARKRSLPMDKRRSKSIPNMRKHPEMMENQPELEGGTLVSIYSDSDMKQKGQKSKGRRVSHRRSKSESESTTRRKQFADQVASNFKEKLEGLENERKLTAPLPVPDMGSDVIEINQTYNDIDKLVDNEEKHKHKKKKKKKKKHKKSKISPEEEKERDERETVTAWIGSSKDLDESSTESDSESTPKIVSAGALLEKQQQLQQDQASLQKQQNQLLLKQQELLEKHKFQQEQLVMFSVQGPPPPKYEESGNMNTSPLPNQTISEENQTA